VHIDVDCGADVWYNKNVNKGKNEYAAIPTAICQRPIPTTDMTVRETTDRKAANNFGAVGARHRAFLFYSLQKGG
jgi:hypothetical protein